GIPVEGQLDHGRPVAARALDIAGRGEKHERETSLFVVLPADLHEAELVAEEIQRGMEIGNAQQGVQVIHRFSSEPAPCFRNARRSPTGCAYRPAETRTGKMLICRCACCSRTALEMPRQTTERR